MPGLLSFYLSTLALLAPLITCAGVGLAWGRRRMPYSGEFLTLLVTSVATPALVFNTLYTTTLDNQTLMHIGLASVLSLLCALGLSALVLRLLGMPVRAFTQIAAFPNGGNLGLPLSFLAFGDAGLSAAIVFFAISAFLHNTVGIRTMGSSTGHGPGWRSPVMLASVAAVILRLLEIPLPAWVLDSAKLLGTITVPLMLIGLGYALSSIPASGMRTGSVLAVMRLVLGAVSGWLVTRALGLPTELANILVLQMVMPCAVISYMFAARYANQGENAAGAVLVSTVAFLLLAPFILALLGAPVPGLNR